MAAEEKCRSNKSGEMGGVVGGFAARNTPTP